MALMGTKRSCVSFGSCFTFTSMVAKQLVWFCAVNVNVPSSSISHVSD